MARNSADDRLVQSKLSENEVVEEEEGEEEEEALSLCDLPINGENQSRKEEEAQPMIKNEEDFDFGSLGGRSLLTESEMCAADKVFFQGQILPLRHSVSSESGPAMFRTDSRGLSRCVSMSESMDHSCFTSTVSSRNSSRSSSIRSHNSSNSCSSITTPTTTHKQQQRVRNQFHSHPSPSPQIRPPSGRYGNISSHRSSTPKSTVWSFFRVGLLKTPGIELEDLKVRGNNSSSSSTNKNFGSRNSTSSTTSSSICNGKNIDIEKRKKQKLFQFGGGCKCSVDAVLDTAHSSRVVVVSNNANEGTKRKKTTKQQQQQQGKQSMSRRRTFEWLKELSLAGVPDEA